MLWSIIIPILIIQKNIEEMNDLANLLYINLRDLLKVKPEILL